MTARAERKDTQVLFSCLVLSAPTDKTNEFQKYSKILKTSFESCPWIVEELNEMILKTKTSYLEEMYMTFLIKPQFILVNQKHILFAKGLVLIQTI